MTPKNLGVILHWVGMAEAAQERNRVESKLALAASSIDEKEKIKRLSLHRVNDVSGGLLSITTHTYTVNTFAFDELR